MFKGVITGFSFLGLEGACGVQDFVFRFPDYFVPFEFRVLRAQLHSPHGWGGLGGGGGGEGAARAPPIREVTGEALNMALAQGSFCQSFSCRKRLVRSANLHTPAMGPLDSASSENIGQLLPLMPSSQPAPSAEDDAWQPNGTLYPFLGSRFAHKVSNQRKGRPYCHMVTGLPRMGCPAVMECAAPSQTPVRPPWSRTSR